MTDLQAIEFLLSHYDGKTSRLARALRCNNQQNVTNWRARKAISPGFRMRALKLLQKHGAEVDPVDWLGRSTRRRVERVTKKESTNGGTRHAAKGKRNGKRQKPKGRKATARKGGRQGAQRAAV